jgi:hypothetical protein
MSIIADFHCADFWPDGSARVGNDNRVGALLDEESPKTILRKHSLLKEPDSDDSGSSAFGDNAVRHLKIEEEADAIFISGNRQFLSAFSGNWHNDDGWHGFWAWSSSSDAFCHISCSFLPDTYGTNFNCFGVYIQRYQDTWQYSWGYPLCCSMGFSNHQGSLEECQAYAEHCWSSLCSHTYPWGEEMSLNLQFTVDRLYCDEIRYPVSPVRDIEQIFQKYFKDYSNVNAIQTKLLTDCIADLEVSDNNIANARDLIGLINDFRNGRIKSIYDTIQGFQYGYYRTKTGGRIRYHGKLEKAGKIASDGWLQYRYMYNTTKADLEQFIDAAIDDRLRRITDQTVKHPLRASYSDDGEEWHLKCRLHESNHDPFMALAERVRRFGFMPDLHTMWDMIPFSFAVDWFIPVDDTLSEIDRYWYSQGYDFDELLYSRKRTKTLMLAGVKLHLTSYERWLEGARPIGDFSYASEKKGKCLHSSINHQADSVSLLVTMMH